MKFTNIEQDQPIPFQNLRIGYFLIYNGNPGVYLKIDKDTYLDLKHEKLQSYKDHDFLCIPVVIENIEYKRRR